MRSYFKPPFFKEATKEVAVDALKNYVENPRFSEVNSMSTFFEWKNNQYTIDYTYDLLKQFLVLAFPNMSPFLSELMPVHYSETHALSAGETVTSVMAQYTELTTQLLIDRLENHAGETETAL